MSTTVMYESVFEEALSFETMGGVEVAVHGAWVNLPWRSAPWRLVSNRYLGGLHPVSE